jgi:hypothetical protein
MWVNYGWWDWVPVPDNVSDVSGMTMWRKAWDDDVEESPG